MTGLLHVTTLSAVEAGILQSRLREAEFEFGCAPHAVFRAWSHGVHVTYYESGKLVVQGKGTPAFVTAYLGGIEEPPRDPLVDLAVVGSDESGKGDYFGPLVVAACLVGPENRGLLEELRVTDSKKAPDPRILVAERLLKEALPHAVVTLRPEEYNRAYARTLNLNILLGRAHARAIEGVLRQKRCRVVLSDKFGDERFIRDELGALGREVELLQKPRAEAHPAVAAASFLARAEFLHTLRELEEETVAPLPRGAGTAVEEAAREIVRLQGRDVLARVAKLHFKITERVA
ncbi:MAG: ribonuclease HIII [Planctomycetota bacterium]